MEAEPKPRAQIDVNKAREDPNVSSPDGTPSFISVDDRLRAMDMKSPPAHLCSRGRDFGGSYSGQNSCANSTDADSSEDERTRKRRLANVLSSKAQQAASAAGLKLVTGKSAALSLEETDGKSASKSKREYAMANRLGDSPVSSSSDGHACCEHHDHEAEHHEGEHADDEREKEVQDNVNEADELFDLDRAEREDRSIKGSVY